MGIDPRLGAYSQYTISFGEAGSLAVQYFLSPDAFIFKRFPNTPELPSAWPSFSIVGDDAPGSQNVTRCLSWDEHYFFPGYVLFAFAFLLTFLLSLVLLCAANKLLQRAHLHRPLPSQ